MSWHDPDRMAEPEEETALRTELRGLLGLPARDARSNYFEIEPTPELVRLADDLRREARRRSHTARKRSSWMLAAAALPFAVTLAGVGAWGLAQRHKVDQLAARVAEQESQVQRLATALQAAPAAQPAALPIQAAPAPTLKARPPQVLLLGKTAPKGKPKELVIPVERSAEPNLNDTTRVKAP
jgi:outer membrane murein-binding lipoprotein Lpp